jgi:hypothetical protein
MPMDDASLAPEANEMPEDPNMMGGMGNDMPMDGEAPMDDNEMGGDETMDIINQLSPKDKEAVKSYAESLISKDESGDNAEEAQDVPAQDGLNMEAPMNETFIFRKKQLNKLMENFGPTETELEKDKKPNLVKKQKKTKKTPFNAPDFE